RSRSLAAAEAPASATDPQSTTEDGLAPSAADAAADSGPAASAAARSDTDPPGTDLFALRPPAPAGGPEELAARIAAAEGTIRMPASTEAQVAEAALFHQAAYRQLADRPDWDATVLGAVPPGLARV